MADGPLVPEQEVYATRYRARRDDEYMRLLRDLPAGHTTSRDAFYASYDAHSDWLRS